MGESLSAASLTISASRLIVTSRSVPMLKTSPTASGVSISRISDSMTSLTCAKQRDCSPLPKTVIGLPCTAWAAKVGSTMP